MSRHYFLSESRVSPPTRPSPSRVNIDLTSLSLSHTHTHRGTLAHAYTISLHIIHAFPERQHKYFSLPSAFMWPFVQAIVPADRVPFSRTVFICLFIIAGALLRIPHSSCEPRSGSRSRAPRVICLQPLTRGEALPFHLFHSCFAFSEPCLSINFPTLLSFSSSTV